MVALVEGSSPPLAAALLSYFKEKGTFATTLEQLGRDLCDAPRAGRAYARVERETDYKGGGLRFDGFFSELLRRAASPDSSLYVVGVVLSNGAPHAFGVDTGRSLVFDGAPDDGASFVSEIGVLQSLEADGVHVVGARRLVVATKKRKTR